jgi:hypothetical protein
MHVITGLILLTSFRLIANGAHILTPKAIFCDHEIIAVRSVTSLGLMPCETWADPSVTRKRMFVVTEVG